MRGLALVAGLVWAVTSTAHAADIVWDTPVATVGKHQLIDGTLVLALNGGNAVTVREAGRDGTATYAFARASYGTLDYAPNAPDRLYYSAGSVSTGAADFDAVINSFAWSANASAQGIQTLSGLTPGTTYRIQLFYNDQRFAREMQFSASVGTAPTQLSSQGAGWGQNVTGTFTADGPTQEIVHTALGFANAHFNALLVTAVNDTIVWGPVTDTTGKAQLVGGQVHLAANGGPRTTVSGAGPSGGDTVAFSGGSYGSLNFEPATSGRVFRNITANTGDPAFDAMLGGFGYARGGVTTATHQLTGLTPGQRYGYQFFFYDPRDCCSGRSMRLYDPAAPEAAVDIAARADGPGFGQHVIGEFVASGPVKTVVHETLGFANLHYTAIVVTELDDTPTATIHGDTFTTERLVRVFPTFPSAVGEFSGDDLVITGGTLVSLTGEGRYFTAEIALDGAGDLRVALRDNAVSLEAMPGQWVRSNTLTVENRAFTGDLWVVEGQDGWSSSGVYSAAMTVQDGALTPTGDTAQYHVNSDRFATPRQAASVILEQSPVWDNWTGVPNIGPSGARDAPVLLSVEDGDYYFLARNGTDQNYSAWHSTDMATWSLRGAVTPPGDGRWVTSAEMKDGLFYVYADVPNDQDPHVFIDDNLDDGIAGRAGGPALTKQACGSDAAFFRNDSDGLFHVIYEDWTPINARQHSWDSPLAGHASSPDGVNGFVPGEHRPPIDLRTDATGLTSTYAHPQIGTCTYDVHEDGQDAFGDWTAIKVGPQYYLFADYDEHDSGIRVGRFTSKSINDQFAFIGELGAGHPDPTVGFAEGQFYLITQQATDYVSPGPWVDGVDVQVMVDTTNNGVFDTGTPWTRVAESYDHKAGFARVVERTPAALDLEALPAGYAFQLRIRIDNTRVPAVAPLITRAEMRFE